MKNIIVSLMLVIFIDATYTGETLSDRGGNQKLNIEKTLTAEQALEGLRQAWKTQIKKHAKTHGSAKIFEIRLAGTESEIERNSYKTKKMSFLDVLTLLERPDGEPSHFLFGTVNDLPKDGTFWVLEWKNLLSGGFVAIVDAYSGKVFLIQILIEG